MDFYYDTQIRATAPRAATGTYSGPARQFGSGAAGLGALAVRVGRSTLPLLAKYALPVVKKVGRNLITAAIPELADVLRGKKKLKHAVKTSVKKGVSRSVSQALVNQQAAAMNYRNKVSAPAAGRAARGGAAGGGAGARGKINAGAITSRKRRTTTSTHHPSYADNNAKRPRRLPAAATTISLPSGSAISRSASSSSKRKKSTTTTTTKTKRRGVSGSSRSNKDDIFANVRFV